MTVSVSSAVVTALSVSQVTLALLIPTLNPSGSALAFDSNSLVDAVPDAEDSWPVKQARNDESGPDGPEALASIYTKYKKPVPEELDAIITRRRKRDSFQATIQDTFNKAFTIRTNIGLSEKKFDLIVDTASAGLWVLSEEAANTKLQESYIPENSLSSEKMNGYLWEIAQFNGKTASGDVYTDFVSFDTSKGPVSFENQAIQVANSASGFDRMAGVSGVMGMAFGSRNPIKPEPQPTFFDNVMDSLDEKVFTIDMKQLAAGSVEFGAIDSQKYYGDIGYADVLNENGYWNFTIGGLFNGATPAADSVEYVVADTSSSFVMLPMPYVTMYYSQIVGAGYSDRYGGALFPCDSEVYDFTFEVGGVEMAIPAEDIKFSKLRGNPDYCFGALQSSDKLGFNLIGSTAFKSSFVVFDPVNFKIGWAKKPLRSEDSE
ncbi:uncharacterized protein BROUX77_001690 [Berkeleyomyces rouxiae]|uniref:uncharacterized protein n=1 Tax=Berkeleyomyces rouxiae TaxID=2035830 RepID=UPI003B81B67D